MNKIYLDNGATTKTDEKVVEAMLPFFSEKYGNASSVHHFGQEARDATQKNREIIANYVNAGADEILFTSGGTESDNLAIKGIAYANKKKGNHIIISPIEHHAVLNSCEKLEKEGFEITILPINKEGIVDPKDIEKEIKENTILVSIMHANNEVGTVQPIEEIGRICKEKKVLFHSDAVQSLTKLPIDVKKINIDLMSFSAHKIHGPKGIGALYIKKGTNIQAQTDGGAHEFGLRAGTENVPGIVGFGKAVEIADDAHNEKMLVLRDKLTKDILEQIPDTQLNGSASERLCNNVNISFKYVEGESILLHLDSKGIAASTGSACTSHSLKPSHVLTSMGIPVEIAHGSIRLTLSKHTTEEDVSYVVESLKEIITNLRKISALVK